MKSLFIVAALVTLPLTAHAITITPTFPVPHEGAGCDGPSSFTSQGFTFQGFGRIRGPSGMLIATGGGCSPRLSISMTDGGQFDPVRSDSGGSNVSRDPDFEYLQIEGYRSGELIATETYAGTIRGLEFDQKFSGIDLLILRMQSEPGCSDLTVSNWCGAVGLDSITLEPVVPGGDVSVVPIPPAGLLLVSGIAALFGRRAIPWFRRSAS